MQQTDNQPKKKSHYVIFNKNKTFPISLNPLFIGTQQIHREHSTKFLGVTIDEKLNWKTHIQNTRAKINKQCGILWQIKSSLTVNAMKQIYISLVYPHLMYCQVVWGAVCYSNIRPLITAQKRVIRIVTGLNKFDHTHEYFKNLKLLKLNDINLYSCAIFVFTSLYIRHNGLFNFRHNAHYPLRNSKLLQLPQINSVQSQSSILYHGVIVWNNLPTDIRSLDNIATFKRKMKEYLLSQY